MELDEAVNRTTIPSYSERSTQRHGQAISVHLVVLSGSSVGNIYQITQPVNLIGRESEAQIHIADAEISRRHAVIYSDKGAYRIRDLGSRNGTRVNGVTIEAPRILKRGDKISLGTRTVVRFSHEGEVETEYAQKMYDQLLRDSLTGIFNRRHLDARLREEVAFARRHRRPLTVLMLDIDHFKHINDAYGHPAGDQVLQGVAHLIADNIRTEDVVARYGGEEFAVICRDTDVEGATVVAARIRRHVADHEFVVDEPADGPIHATISIGLADLESCDPKQASSLIEAADQALYMAKRQGRNRVIGFDARSK